MINSISNLTQDHLVASVLWIYKMSDARRWNLIDSEVASLLGGIRVETYRDLLFRAERGLQITMTEDGVERLSLLLGMWEGLQHLVPSGRQDLAFAWFNKPNSSLLLKNHSIKNYLLENNTLEGFSIVRDYLDHNR
jgi:hypothetical protein